MSKSIDKIARDKGYPDLRKMALWSENSDPNVHDISVWKVTLADENIRVCDEFLGTLENNGFRVTYPTLYTRKIVGTDKDKLALAMDYLTGSFSFEAKELYPDNAYGYEIILPRIMIDFD